MGSFGIIFKLALIMPVSVVMAVVRTTNSSLAFGGLKLILMHQQ